MNYFCPRRCAFSIPSSIHCHSLSRMRMWPTMYCENVIQFREMFAAAAKSHCYTLRHAIWKKPPNSLYNHSVQDKSCLFLIPRSSCNQSTSTMHFIADEPILCGSGIVKMKPQKYVHVEMMFIQQDYQ